MHLNGWRLRSFTTVPKDFGHWQPGKQVRIGSVSAKKAQSGAVQTQNYRAAYEQLARIAAQLEDGETDLDKVLPLLAEAQAAYGVCRERIEALKLALENGQAQPSDTAASDTVDEDPGADDPDEDDFF